MKKSIYARGRPRNSGPCSIQWRRVVDGYFQLSLPIYSKPDVQGVRGSILPDVSQRDKRTVRELKRKGKM